MKIPRRTLFPPEPRCLPGQRGLNVTLRTLHLVGVAGMGGGYLCFAADETWYLYQDICLVSGALLALLFLYSSGIWLLQLRGLAILLKVLLLCAVFLWPDLAAVSLILILVLSGWIAHAPGRVRYYSPFFRRRTERLPD